MAPPLSGVLLSTPVSALESVCADWGASGNGLGMSIAPPSNPPTSAGSTTTAPSAPASCVAAAASPPATPPVAVGPSLPATPPASGSARSWLESKVQPPVTIVDARPHATRNGVHCREVVFTISTSHRERDAGDAEVRDGDRRGGRRHLYTDHVDVWHVLICEGYWGEVG